MVKWSYLNYRSQSSDSGLPKVKKYVRFLSPHLFFAASNNNICSNDRGFWFVFCRLCLNIGQDDLYSAGCVWLSAGMTCILQALFEYRPGHRILWGLSCFSSVLAENDRLILQIRPHYPVKLIIYCHQIIQRFLWLSQAINTSSMSQTKQIHSVTLGSTSNLVPDNGVTAPKHAGAVLMLILM